MNFRKLHKTNNEMLPMPSCRRKADTEPKTYYSRLDYKYLAEYTRVNSRSQHTVLAITYKN